MRLMDRDAWKVKDAPSIVEGVNLLKNRRATEGVTIGAFDGRVAAYFMVGHASYFVTTNAHYVPFMPPTDPKKIMVQRDMCYGPDDPVLWPQLYTDTFCHLAAIPKAPTSAQGQQKFGVMWWNPAHDNFVCPKSGLTLTHGLGRLCLKQFTKLSDLVHTLIDEYEQYLKSLPAGTTLSLLFPRLVQTLCLSLERLRIPTTYTRMRLGVVSVQREYLELTGLLQYMMKYKPRMEGIKDLNAHTAYPNDCISCFTQDPPLPRLSGMHASRADEKILRVVVPFAVADFLEMNPAAGFSPAAATDQLDNHPHLLHRCTQNTPWYWNLFAAASPNIASTSLAGSPDVASASVAGTSVSVTFRGGRAEVPSQKVSVSGSPYAAAQAQAKAKKEAQGPNPNAKQWQDVLQGKVVKQGKMGTRVQVRSAGLEELLLPAFQACGIDILTEFPVPLEAVPTMCMHTVKELLWELAEINFRYEFLALDARASGLDRPDECRRCFVGEGLIGLDYLGLMCDWSVPCTRPKEIDTAKERMESEWDGSTVCQLERKVTQYYTQSFYELFGRAAVVCMRLEHEIGS
ncbi:hypothetical protein B0H10DRAFT_2206989 [Mycena sp. CBHHK59/15]|nr:hypothetical protein B0H10DRAFT_2206989 [Mycena sp. CBHHK59/15]